MKRTGQSPSLLVSVAENISLDVHDICNSYPWSKIAVVHEKVQGSLRADLLTPWCTELYCWASNILGPCLHVLCLPLSPNPVQLSVMEVKDWV